VREGSRKEKRGGKRRGERRQPGPDLSWGYVMQLPRRYRVRSGGNDATTTHGRTRGATDARSWQFDATATHHARLATHASLLEDRLPRTCLCSLQCDESADSNEASSLRQDESSKRGDESQQIAAWQLLYRVQHPARYLSRLQTIPSPDIEQIYPWSTVRGGTTISQVRGPAAVPSCPARQTWALVEPARSPREERAALGRQITLFGASRLSRLPRVIVASTRRDTALEAFRHNPTDGSLAPPAPRPSA
jgi:hypothetical protein